MTASAPVPWSTRAEGPQDVTAIRDITLAALDAARVQGENLVVVLGHADYYPRFGFTPASAAGVTAPFEVPDDAFLVLALDPGRTVPRGEVAYPAAFGV